MAVYAFKCKCGSMLITCTKVRPVCRRPGCGKQMALDRKVSAHVSYQTIERFNAVYGVSTNQQQKPALQED